MGFSFFAAAAALHGAELDAFFVFRALDDAIDENARGVDLVGIKFAGLDQMLDLGHADFAAGGDHRVEVAGGFSKNQVARFVAFPRFHKRDLGLDAGLEHILLAVENFRLLAFGQFGAEAGAGVKPRDARAAGAQPLSQCALRDELEIEFARQHLAFELLVLADVGGHDFLHLPGGEENAHAEAIHARVVPDDCEAFHPAVVQGGDEIFRDTAEPEPARGDRHVVVKKAGQRGLCVGVNFAHVERSLTTDYTDGHG